MCGAPAVGLTHPCSKGIIAMVRVTDGCIPNELGAPLVVRDAWSVTQSAIRSTQHVMGRLPYTVSIDLEYTRFRQEGITYARRGMVELSAL